MGCIVVDITDVKVNTRNRSLFSISCLNDQVVGGVDFSVQWLDNP